MENGKRTALDSPSILIEKNKIRSDIAHEQKAEYTLFEVDAGMNVEKIL